MNNALLNAIHILSEIQSLCKLVTNEQFIAKCNNISGYSIGAHVRHSLEMFVVLSELEPNSLLNYDKRRREANLESNPELASELCESLKITLQKDDYAFEMESLTQFGNQIIHTSYHRELMYCSDHAVHHLALIKIACNELEIRDLPENLGVAYSTQVFNASGSAYSCS